MYCGDRCSGISGACGKRDGLVLRTLVWGYWGIWPWRARTLLLVGVVSTHGASRRKEKPLSPSLRGASTPWCQNLAASSVSKDVVSKHRRYNWGAASSVLTTTRLAGEWCLRAYCPRTACARFSEGAREKNRKGGKLTCTAHPLHPCCETPCRSKTNDAVGGVDLWYASRDSPHAAPVSFCSSR